MKNTLPKKRKKSKKNSNVLLLSGYFIVLILFLLSNTLLASTGSRENTPLNVLEHYNENYSIALSSVRLADNEKYKNIEIQFLLEEKGLIQDKGEFEISLYFLPSNIAHKVKPTVTNGKTLVFFFDKAPKKFLSIAIHISLKDKNESELRFYADMNTISVVDTLALKSEHEYQIDTLNNNILSLNQQVDERKKEISENNRLLDEADKQITTIQKEKTYMTAIEKNEADDNIKTLDAQKVSIKEKIFKSETDIAEFLLRIEKTNEQIQDLQELIQKE